MMGAGFGDAVAAVYGWWVWVFFFLLALPFVTFALGWYLGDLYNLPHITVS